MNELDKAWIVDLSQLRFMDTTSKDERRNSMSGMPQNISGGGLLGKGSFGTVQLATYLG